LNQKLDSELQIKLSDPVKSSLQKFHEAILSNIDNASMLTDEQKHARYLDLVNGSPDTVFKLLDNSFAKEFENTKNILAEKGIDVAQYPFVAQSLDKIIDSTKKLKVKYKFFEYKYIELNIFTILLIQHLYQTLDNFVVSILEFNKFRDANREKLLKDTLDVFMNIMTNAELQLSPDDFDNMNKLVVNIKDNIERKNKDFDDRMKSMVDVATENLTGLLNVMSESTQVDMLKKLNEKPNIKEKAGYVGGFIREGSRPRSTSGGKKKQSMQGGFVRDASHFPQAFYELKPETAS
jgi:hypothetical protein